MTRVYIEHDDHHNPAHVSDFESVDAVLDHILRCESYIDGERADRKALWTKLFDEDDDEYLGEVEGCDRWKVITAESADVEARYWTDLAQRIRDDRPAHGG